MRFCQVSPLALSNATTPGIRKGSAPPTGTMSLRPTSDAAMIPTFCLYISNAGPKLSTCFDQCPRRMFSANQNTLFEQVNINPRQNSATPTAIAPAALDTRIPRFHTASVASAFTVPAA